MSSRSPNRRSAELMLGLTFSVVATAITLVAGEGLIRAVAHRRLIYNIEMVRYATQLKIPDPLGEVSHVHRPSSRASLMGVDVSLNSLGNRGPEMAPRTPSRRRVLVLGSSITMGWGVPFDRTMTATTERLLNTAHPFGPLTSFEFINAGIGNYNTVFQHALFRRQFPIVQPDMVVLQYFLSDVQPRTMGRNSALLRHSFLAAFLFDRWSQMKLRFGGEYKDLFTLYKDLYAGESTAWRVTQKHVTEMRDACARANVPFIVVVTPDIHDLSPGTPYQALYQQIQDAFRQKSIPTISAFDEMQAAFGKDVSAVWVQSDDPHPNARGHAVMADVLYRYIVRENPLELTRTTPPS